MFCFIFFHVFSQSQKWQIQVGFEIHDWLRYSSSILKSLAIWGLKKKIIIPILPKNSVLGDNKRFGLVVTNSKNSVNSFFFLFFAFRIILHIIKKSQKKKFAQRNSLWKFSQKFTHFFLSCTHLLRQLSFFLCVLNLAEWIEKKIEIFQGGNHSFSGKSFLAMNFKNSLF